MDRREKPIPGYLHGIHLCMECICLFMIIEPESKQRLHISFHRPRLQPVSAIRPFPV
ncbi:hypothetical protein ASZ90_009215 [hydrocarbon metagenome]|uniref:Uncharacterized protein n=1 Tax=hydrocarbon metagenome TaxID=938273 RepID=A0A0W8FJH7_9ZZZZ